MLLLAPEYIDTLVDISRQRGWLETAFQLIRFSQCMKQGLFRNANPLQQIPHLTDESMEQIAKESQSKQMVLKDYLNTPNDEKKGLEKLTSEQKEDVFATCSIIPCRKTTIDLYVEDEDDEDEDDDDISKGNDKNKVSGTDIYEGDLVTVRVSIKTSNFEAKKNAPALTPKFPDTTHEYIYIILTNQVSKGNEDEAGIHAMDKVAAKYKVLNKKNEITGHVIQHELKFMAPPKTGAYQLQLYVFSDTYLGLDEFIDVPFSVRPASELPEYIPHPDDAQLDNEPTLFEQVMAANAEEADSSDDEDEQPNRKQDDENVDSDGDGDDN
jgi:translocation protein SEC63